MHSAFQKSDGVCGMVGLENMEERQQDDQQIPRSPRRNGLPVKLRDGALLMRYQHTARALVALSEIGKIPSSADLILHHAPEAFKGGEGVPTMGH